MSCCGKGSEAKKMHSWSSRQLWQCQSFDNQIHTVDVIYIKGSPRGVKLGDDKSMSMLLGHIAISKYFRFDLKVVTTMANYPKL